MGVFSPVPPFIATPSATSNPNASNPLTPATQIALANRPNTVAPAASAAAAAPVAPTNPGQMTPEQWDQYIKIIQDAYAASSGWAREQLASQLADAQKGRDNAYQIAQLNAQTSRYGVDAQSKTAMAQLKQNAAQFEASHGLEMQKYGLSVAQAAAAYQQSPDQIFAFNDFKSALGRVGQGYAPSPISAQGTPHAKTYDDFAALATLGGGSLAPSAGAAGAGAAGTGGAGGGGSDPRLKAMQAVATAMPPSDGQGHDGQDWAAIDAIKNLYFAGRPGEVERLGAPRRKIAQAGLARAGYDVANVENERMRGLPGQQNVRAA